MQKRHQEVLAMRDAAKEAAARYRILAKGEIKCVNVKLRADMEDEDET